MVRVYLAASWRRQQEIRTLLRPTFEQHGLHVTSNWLNSPDGDDEAFLRRSAIQDLRDIDRCDYFVLISNSPNERAPGGGRYFEMGYAFANHKTIMVIGEPETVFHYLPAVLHFASADYAIRYIIDEETRKAYRKMRRDEMALVEARERVIIEAEGLKTWGVTSA